MSLSLLSKLPRTTLRLTSTLRRLSSTMSAPQKFEFICIMPDKEGALEQRLAVRPRHFAGLTSLVENGTITWGGAMLNSVPASPDAPMDFRGSVLTVAAGSLEKCWEILKADPYVVEGVWDIEKAQVYPFKCAVRQPLEK
ncbi:dimeric alpha-beta barrel [Geopyxis carbonaria]|nr:dimeric alpha-beta barrel [Geopyxis carbonaria]